MVRKQIGSKSHSSADMLIAAANTSDHDPAVSNHQDPACFLVDSGGLTVCLSFVLRRNLHNTQGRAK